VLPAAALLGVLLTVLLAPGLLLVAATLLLRGALTPTAWLALTGLSLAGLALTGLTLARSGASGLAMLSRLTGLRPSWLLAPSAAALLRRLPLLRRLLGTLAPTATTLGGRLLLSPATLAPLSPLLPARLAPRLLPRTPRSLRRRRHIRSF
jgi:hypothetical protein